MVKVKIVLVNNYSYLTGGVTNRTILLARDNSSNPSYQNLAPSFFFKLMFQILIQSLVYIFDVFSKFFLQIFKYTRVYWHTRLVPAGRCFISFFFCGEMFYFLRPSTLDNLTSSVKSLVTNHLLLVVNYKIVMDNIF